MARETIDSEEFDQRLTAANDRLRLELTEAEERVRKLDALLRQKEAFSLKLDGILAELERDEAEIAAAENELAPRHRRTKRRRTVTASVSA